MIKYLEQILGLPLPNTLDTRLWAEHGRQWQCGCDHISLRILGLYMISEFRQKGSLIFRFVQFWATYVGFLQ